MKKLLLSALLLASTFWVQATTFTVNSLAATNTGSANSGTLRYCMNIATITPGGPHNIIFSVAGTIAIGSNANILPNITSTGLTIDATTAPGYTGSPVIQLDGAGTTSGNGFTIATSAVTILGIDITNFAFRGVNVATAGNGFRIGSAAGGCVIRNSGYYGIQVNGANNGIIENCRIGVDPTGTTCQMNQYDGIDIQGGGSNQIINSHIACNGYNGIQLGNATNGNIIKGNIIGPLMGSCTFNGYRGIDIEEASTNNVIGGTGAGEGNKIAGNDYWGIEVKDAGSVGNIISGNSMSCNAYDAIDVNTGGNNNILPPVITAASGTTVSGTSAANAVVEVFRAQNGASFGCPGTPQEQGADYLGTTTANGAGAWSLTGTFSGFVVATQRTTDGSSSFSNAFTTGITPVWVNGCSGPIGSGGGSAPAANFSVNTDTVCVGECIDFTDLSTNTPTSWAWTFGGGTPASSTQQDPTICYMAAGSYTVQLAATNANGTGNTTQNIVVLPLPTLTINQAGTLLTVTAGHPAYQWYLNGNLIPGATTSSLVISSNGNYTCAATGTNGCSDTSAVFPVTNISVEELGYEDIAMFPNPATQQITIQLGSAMHWVSKIEIKDVTGKTLTSVHVDRAEIKIQLSSLPQGMYLVHLSGKRNYMMKLSKL